MMKLNKTILNNTSNSALLLLGCLLIFMMTSKPTLVQALVVDNAEADNKVTSTASLFNHRSVHIRGNKVMMPPKDNNNQELFMGDADLTEEEEEDDFESLQEQGGDKNEYDDYDDEDNAFLQEIDDHDEYLNHRSSNTTLSTTTVERRLDHTKTCKLKLYWKEGYEWQEERFERKWCVQNSDGRAKIKKCRDTSRQKWVLNEDDNTIRMKNDDEKCLEVRNNRVYVKDCKSSGSSRDRQKFDFDFDDDKFEIKRAGRCMTQQHHPRENEKLKMQRCGVARRDDTSLWECD